MKTLAIPLLLVAFAAPALGSGANHEEEHQLPMSQGIAHPLYTGGINGTGFVYNNALKPTLSFTDQYANFSAYGLGLELEGGNGNFGAGGGLTYTGGYTPAGLPVSIAATLGAFAGFGVNLKSVALGARAGFSLSPALAFNSYAIGALINPNGSFRVGLNASFAPALLPTSFGAGIAFDPGKIFTLGLDAISNSPFTNVTLFPGILFGPERFKAAFSYGFNLSNIGLTVGTFTAGLSIELAKSCYLTFVDSGITSGSVLFSFPLTKG